MGKVVNSARCAVLVGPYTSGKTTLLEALLAHSGVLQRKGRVPDGNTLGDWAAEARARQMTVEPNVAQASYLGESWNLIDCPGSVELAQDAVNALMAADVCVVVAEPEPQKAVALGPLFKFLDDYQIPHILFVNKMDRATLRISELLAAFQAVSSRPLILRQVPMREGDTVTGVIDLVSERAWRYQPHKPSALVEIPEDSRARKSEARREMLEALADFDDALLEQLLEDRVPSTDAVYAELAKDLQQDLIVPVLLGSAENDNGIQRLWKALRHETPTVERAAERQAIPEAGDFAATIVKTYHLPHTGKLSLARIWRGKVKEGAQVGGERLSALLKVMGGQQEKLASAKAGDLVAFGRMEALQTGDLVTGKGRENGSILWPERLSPVYGRAISPLNRQDEVKLSAAIAKLIEEDPSLALEHNAETHEMVLWGQGDIHLQIAGDRLKNKHNVEVSMRAPQPAYRETIRRAVDQHARHKRQTGGHGQFADIKVKIRPLARGEGFKFEDEIVGGAVPRQYIPAVEHGIREYLDRGPLGFPVVDLAVTLYDGQFHAVDSSDMAFKIAGRLAMAEGLPKCEPVLLEPISSVSLYVPNEFTSKVNGLISGRRGQILGFDARPGWEGWDEVKAQMPQAELTDLIVDLRSLTQGAGSFTSSFDHLQELHGRLADKVIEQRQAQAAQ